MAVSIGYYEKQSKKADLIIIYWFAAQDQLQQKNGNIQVQRTKIIHIDIDPKGFFCEL